MLRKEKKILVRICMRVSRYTSTVLKNLGEGRMPVALRATPAALRKCDIASQRGLRFRLPAAVQLCGVSDALREAPVLVHFSDAYVPR